MENCTARSCGLFGECLESGVCDCLKGWSQTISFSFFVEGRLDDTYNQNDLVCNSNKALLKAIYSLNLVAGVILFAAYFSVLTKWRQVVRQMPVFVSSLMCSSASIIFLTNTDSSFGTDMAFTLLLSLGVLCGNMSGIVFFNKFVHLQKKLILPEKTKKSVFQLQRTLLFMAFVDIFSITCLFATIFVKNSEKAYKIAFYAFASVVLRSFLGICLSIFLGNRILEDLELLSMKQDANRIVKTIASMKTTKKIMIWISSFNFVMYGIPLISKQAMALWHMILPLWIGVSGLVCVFTLFVQTNGLRNRRKLNTTNQEIADTSVLVLLHTQHLVDVELKDTKNNSSDVLSKAKGETVRQSHPEVGLTSVEEKIEKRSSFDLVIGKPETVDEIDIAPASSN